MGQKSTEIEKFDQLANLRDLKMKHLKQGQLFKAWLQFCISKKKLKYQTRNWFTQASAFKLKNAFCKLIKHRDEFNMNLLNVEIIEERISLDSVKENHENTVKNLHERA